MLHIQCSFSFMGSLKATKSYIIVVWAKQKEESVMADLFLIISLLAIFVYCLMFNFRQEETIQEYAPCKACGSTEWDTSGHNDGYCWSCSDRLDCLIALSNARKELIKAAQKLDELHALQEEMEEAEERRAQVKKMRNGATHPRCSVCSSRHCTWDHASNGRWGKHPAKPHKARK